MSGFRRGVKLGEHVAGRRHGEATRAQSARINRSRATWRLVICLPGRGQPAFRKQPGPNVVLDGGHRNIRGCGQF